MVKEASDNKSEEKIPLMKLNFNGGLFSSLLSSGAPLTIFVANFMPEVRKKCKIEPPPQT